MSEEKWLVEVEQRVEEFANRHRFVYRKSKREIAASFEVGCFLALLAFYERYAHVELKQLRDDTFRYLTSPQGHPSNFSYVLVRSEKQEFELRQQVRIRSHLHPDIAFTPDILVISGTGKIESKTDVDYANGRQRFAYVDSRHVVAAHECKSLTPFPELLVSFVGMVVAAHSWLDGAGSVRPARDGTHFGPTLFVGGSPRSLLKRMAFALREVYPVNIIMGMHKGIWNLRGKWSRLEAHRPEEENVA